MFRDNAQLLTSEIHNFVLNHGALGDVICSLPAIIQARAARPTAPEMRVWCPGHQQDLLRCLLAPYGKFEVRDIAAFPMKRVEREGWDGGAVSINQMAFNTHTRNRVHMVDYAFGCLTDSRPESMLERSYPTAAPLGPRTVEGRYAVIPVGATSENKLFRASVMAPVLRWLQERGYAVVLVGTKVSRTFVEGDTKPIPIIDQAALVPADVLERCVDLREKTTLLELRDVCGYASAVVGVDGGTLHLAGTTDAPIVYAMGTTLPKHRYIARRGDPSYHIRYLGPRDLECTGCQSNWTLTSLDFRHCAYGDNACMEKLHPEDFINAMKELGL